MRRSEVLLGNLEEAHYKAKDNITKAQNKQKARHDQSHIIESYSIGDKVLLEESSLLTSYSAKLNPKFTGPYYVHDVCGNGIYKLRTICGENSKKPKGIERVLKKAVHGNWLKKYTEPLGEEGLQTYKYRQK